jgi:hypothetical protein
LIDSLCTGGASRTCGNGVITRSRSIITAPQGNGRACPSLDEQATCFTQCSVDCVEGAWSQWSTCTAACGGGKASRARVIDVAAQHCGRSCGASSEEQTCNAQTCAPNIAPIDCVVSVFVVPETERCSVPACGGGNVTARATVVTSAQGAGKACPPLEKQQPCNTATCPAIDSSGVRWRLVSSDAFELFVWTTFRRKLAYYLVIDELRLQLISVTSGSTIVEVTLLDAVGDPAMNHVDQLQRIADNTASGLNIVASTEIVISATATTTTPNEGSSTMPTTVAMAINEPSPTALSDDTITIIIAVVASVGGLLLIGFVIFCVVQRKKTKTASTPTEMKSAMADGWSDRDTTTTLRKRESEYQSAVPLAANVHNSSAAIASNKSDYYDGPTVRGEHEEEESVSSAAAPVYHRPPASTTTEIAPERSSKPSSHSKKKNKSKHKSKSKNEPQPIESQPSSTTGSLVRKSIRSTEVLHIPIEEIEMGKQLGQGAFGVVYKGQWDHKTVAVKQVKASNIIGGDKAIAEFEAEVSQMASTAYHENLVQLYGVTTLENGDMAAVVEFCAQGSLVDALYGSEKKARDWTVSELFSVAHGAACGVAHLHRQGVIHRDIAARNVLLAGKRDLIAKVADFGMARLLSESVYDEQTTLNAVGPLKWMAPEQMERRAYSRASDVFAFGVLLYEIFKREVPWQGVSNIITATKVVNGERMDVSSRKIPREIASLMLECWAGEPDKRPSIKHVQRVLHDNAPSSDESGAES